MAVPIQIKRGTRAQLDAAATAGELRAGEPYLITDEGRMAVGSSATAYTDMALLSEVGGGATTIDGGTADGTTTGTIDGGIA